jgi:hypothetical protein
MGYLQLAQNNAPECYAGSTICPKTATRLFHSTSMLMLQMTAREIMSEVFHQIFHDLSFFPQVG